MLTQQEAARFLEAQLPELIGRRSTPKQEAYWLDTGDNVTEREMQQIALWVEEKMTTTQWLAFDKAMFKIWNEIKELKNSYSRWRSEANYITRATAMKESGL